MYSAGIKRRIKNSKNRKAVSAEKKTTHKTCLHRTYYDCEKPSPELRSENREVIDMDKNTNKNASKNTEKNAQKGMNRTEFAQEYSIDTGKTEKTNKTSKTNKTNKCN